MKKLKWILLIITIIMMAFFLFATCRKTKAMEKGIDYGSIVNIDAGNYNISNFIGIYQPHYDVIHQDVYLTMIDLGGSDFFLFGSAYNPSTGLTYAYLNYGNTRLISTNYYDYKYLVAYVVNVGTYASLDTPLCINIQVIYINFSQNLGYLDVDNIYFYPDQEQDPQIYINFINGYASSTGLPIKYLYDASYGRYNGLYNAFVYDFSDYQEDTWSELLDTIKEEYVYNTIKDTSLIYNVGYTNGYQAGYDDGYDAGESAGYTAGYNAGSSAGYNSGYWDGYNDGEGAGYRSGYDTGYDDGYDSGLTAGYNNGYADGLADNVAGQTQAYEAGYGQGRHDGYVEGYDRGYNLGYDDGLANGMSGATPVSQTIGVVSSIFAGIGTVLSVQLFPGFPLGILILVPLFFAVLGLILWIWRRN